MTEIYKESMQAGDYFYQKYYGDKEYEGWTEHKHVAAVAKMINMIHNTFNMNITDSVDMVMEIIKKKGFYNPRNLGWSDYCKGFLVGVFFGKPDDFNLKMVEEIEKIWREGSCTCYQDAIQQVYEQHKAEYYKANGVYETAI